MTPKGIKSYVFQYRTNGRPARRSAIGIHGSPRTTQTTRLILRDLVNASVGFENLAAETNHPSKSLHRVLSENGNPSIDNLAAIFGAVRKHLGVAFEARAMQAA